MNKHTISICVASLGLMAGLAWGQDDNPKAMSGSFDKPLAPAAPHAAGMSEYTSIVTDGNDTYKLVIQDGKRTVTHNDEAVPDSRLRTRRGMLEVLDDDGKVACKFDLPARNSPGREHGRLMLAPRAMTPSMPAPPDAPEMVRDQPKVMLGIRMSQGNDGKLEVGQVIAGLAAEKAGVQEGDTLVSLDGKEIENLSSIRSILHDKQPGDKVDLVVRRDDKDVTLPITLQAYESHKLAMSEGMGNGFGGNWSGTTETATDWAADAQKAIEKAIAEIQNSKNTEKLRAEITESLEKAIEAIKSAKADGMSQLQQLGPALSRRFEGWQALQGSGGLPGGARSFVFTAPDDRADQMKSLEEKLDKLQERLDQLSDKLDKLGDKH